MERREFLGNLAAIGIASTFAQKNIAQQIENQLSRLQKVRKESGLKFTVLEVSYIGYDELQTASIS